MADKTAEEKEAGRVVRWREKWKKAHDKAKGENLEVGARKSETIKAILKEVNRAGISSKGFKMQMTLLDHVDSAKGVLDKVRGADDADLMGTFAQLTFQTETALPLFEAADQREMRAAIKAKKAAEEKPAPVEEAETETEEATEDNVTQLHA